MSPPIPVKQLIHGYIQPLPAVMNTTSGPHSDEEQPRQEPKQAKNANKSVQIFF